MKRTKPKRQSLYDVRLERTRFLIRQIRATIDALRADVAKLVDRVSDGADASK